MWMKSGALHRFYGRHGWARRLAMDLRPRVEFAGLGGHKDPAVLRLIAGVRRRRESLLSGHEAFLVHSLAHAQTTLDGVGDAFTDFLAEKPERVVELPTSQAMLIRRGPAPA